MKINLSWLKIGRESLPDQDIFPESLVRARNYCALAAVEAREALFGKMDNSIPKEKERGKRIRKIIEDGGMPSASEQMKWWNNYAAFNESLESGRHKGNPISFESWYNQKIRSDALGDLDVAAGKSLKALVSVLTDTDNPSFDSDKTRVDRGAANGIRLGDADNYRILGSLINFKFRRENYRIKFLSGAGEVADKSGTDSSERNERVFRFAIEDIKAWLKNLSEAANKNSGNRDFFAEELDNIKKRGLKKCPSEISNLLRDKRWEEARDAIYAMAANSSSRRMSKRSIAGFVGLAGLAGWGYLNRGKMEYYLNLLEDKAGQIKSPTKGKERGASRAEKKAMVGSRVRGAISRGDWRGLQNELESYAFLGTGEDERELEYSKRVRDLENLIDGKKARQTDRVYLDRAKLSVIKGELANLSKHSEEIFGLRRISTYLGDFCALVRSELAYPNNSPKIDRRTVALFKEHLPDWERDTRSQLQRELSKQEGEYAKLRGILESDLSDAEIIANRKDDPVGRELTDKSSGRTVTE